MESDEKVSGEAGGEVEEEVRSPVPGVVKEGEEVSREELIERVAALPSEGQGYTKAKYLAPVGRKLEPRRGEGKQGGGRRPKWSEEEIAEAIGESSGLISVAAKRLGYSRRWIERMVERSEVVSAAAREAIEAVKDMAEAKLYEEIGKGKPWAICFFLKCRAKDRGYIERVEQDRREEHTYRYEAKVDFGALTEDEQRRYREILARLARSGQSGSDPA